MRTYAPSPSVQAPYFPLYQMGFLDAEDRERLSGTVLAPRTPLHQLGWMGDNARILASTAPIAATAASAIASATSAGAVAGPIGAAVGLLVGVIAGLWAAHEARARGAKDENAAVNSALQAFDAALHAIFAAANSNDPKTHIPADIAAQQCEAQLQTFWQSMQPHMVGPGRADTSGFGAHCGSGTNFAAPCSGMPGGHKCDKACTAACCVGCQDLQPTIDQAVRVFQSGGGTVQVCGVAGSKYGAIARGGYTLTYTPPAISASSGVASLFGGGGGFGGSLLPLLGVGLVAFLALR